SQSYCLSSPALDPGAVPDPLSEHLITATNPERPAIGTAVAHQEVFPSCCAKPFKIGDCALGSRQDQNVELRCGKRVAHIMDRHIWLVFQRFKVRIIRDAGKADDPDLDRRPTSAGRAPV